MNFILTADWHLRGTRPRCRTDEDWLETQMGHVRQVVELANIRRIPICIVGDIFDTPRVATEVVNRTIEELKRVEYGVAVLAGNHDLPYHSYDNVRQCSFGTLRHSFPELGGSWARNALGAHAAAPFGLDNPEDPAEVVFTHQLVFEDDAARPMEDCGKTADDVAREFKNAKWIFTGDYHTAFVREIVREDGSWVKVVNPGCLNRQVADKMDYQCRVCVVNTDTGTTEWVEILDDSELVQDAYLRDAEAREDRVDAFLELVQDRKEVSLSFIDNLERTLEYSKDIPDAVREEALHILQTIKSKGEAK